MSYHGSAKIELPGREAMRNMDPRLEKVKSSRRNNAFETKYKGPLQPECTHPNGCSGKNAHLPISQQNRRQPLI